MGNKFVQERSFEEIAAGFFEPPKEEGEEEEVNVASGDLPPVTTPP